MIMVKRFMYKHNVKNSPFMSRYSHKREISNIDFSYCVIVDSSYGRAVAKIIFIDGVWYWGSHPREARSMDKEKQEEADAWWEQQVISRSIASDGRTTTKKGGRL